MITTREAAGEYKRKRPTKDIQALLDHIETSGDPIFWG